MRPDGARAGVFGWPRKLSPTGLAGTEDSATPTGSSATCAAKDFQMHLRFLGCIADPEETIQQVE